MALVEAMAYGVPVIATGVGGVPELLENGAGVLAPPGDADALTEALARVLGSSTLRAELARAGRRRVEAEFEVGAIARELVRRFDGAASARARGVGVHARRPHRHPQLSRRQATSRSSGP